MKKVIVAAILIAVVGGLVLKKTQEHTKNQRAFEEYAYEACADWAPCVERLDAFFGICFVNAYDFSVVPGGDTIRLTSFVECMNTDLARDVFEISTEPGAEAPVPVSDLASD